jgi:hypothetical protein
MSLQKNIEKIFDEHGINYFKGNKGNENILNVPYKGIKDPENRINIFLVIDEDAMVVKFTFSEQSNRAMAVENVKSQLLDINASLDFGFLSMKSDSNSLEYRLDYLVRDEFLFEQYNKFIVRCIKVYETLKDRAIIQ